MKNKSEDISVIAVVVTYNRLSLLKESLRELLNQEEERLKKIIVIDNFCNDGTHEYLIDLEKSENKIEVQRMEKNLGGSGGFFYGIKKAVENKADWIWVMDDDTIPKKDSLKKLLEKVTISEKIGFLCSKVLWNENQVHKMNIPEVIPLLHDEPFNSFEPNLLVRKCSFVSMLIKADIVKKIGLPYKEFFIWGDDSEYSARICENDYFGMYVPESVVVHKTPVNYNADIINDNGRNSWKYFYGSRNLLFRIRKKNLLKYLARFIYNIFYLIPKIIICRKNQKYLYSSAILKGTLYSLVFYPKIQRIEEKK